MVRTAVYHEVEKQVQHFFRDRLDFVSQTISSYSPPVQHPRQSVGTRKYKVNVLLLSIIMFYLTFYFVLLGFKSRDKYVNRIYETLIYENKKSFRRILRDYNQYHVARDSNIR